MGYEPLTKWIVLLVVSVQLLAAYSLRNISPISPLFILTAYILGGTANQNLFLAIHEITHNLAFKGIRANKLLALFANLPIGIPYAVTFKVNLYYRVYCLADVRVPEIPPRTPQTNGRGRHRHRPSNAPRTPALEQRCWEDLLLVRYYVLKWMFPKSLSS